MAENRFLQSFCAVAASSVLVCGTLLLLTSTAPWTPPEMASEPSTPDGSRVLAAVGRALDAGEEAFMPERTPASDLAEAPRAYAAPIARLEDIEERDDRIVAEAEGTAQDALPVETAEGPSETQSLPEPLPSIVPEKIGAAADQVGDLLTTLPPRVFASDVSATATGEVAEALAALPPSPPPINAAEKTGPARDEVATVLAELPPPPVVTVVAELASASKSEGLQDGIKMAALNVRAITLASLSQATPAKAKVAVEMPVAPEHVSIVASASVPPSLPQPAETAVAVEMAAAPASPAETRPAESRPAPKFAALAGGSVTDAGPPPPLPRRKPEFASAKLAGLAPAAEAEAAAKAQAVPVSPREKHVTQAEPKQQVAQGGGLFGLFKPGTFAKPMTLAPADQPVTAPKVAVARPGSGAYASQVWAKLARAKPRASGRGSASVSFAIGANGSLGAVRIARSSGNSKIDQLALQTVRNAAPFPAPPSGSASYTIRIDF